MAQAPNGNGKAARYAAFGGVAAVALTLGAAGWNFSGRIASQETTVLQQQARIEALGARLAALENLGRNNSGDIQRIDGSLRETETQHCASDQVRNLMHAFELRAESMLWGKVFGSPMPIDNTYYPTIAHNCGGG